MPTLGVESSDSYLGESSQKQQGHFDLSHPKSAQQERVPREGATQPSLFHSFFVKSFVGIYKNRFGPIEPAGHMTLTYFHFIQVDFPNM